MGDAPERIWLMPALGASSLMDGECAMATIKAPGDDRWPEYVRADLSPTPAGVKVRPLVWVEMRGYWEAKTPVGTYSCGFDDGWWAELEGPESWEWEAPEDPRCYDGPSAAMLGCFTDYEARILAALKEGGG